MKLELTGQEDKLRARRVQLVEIQDGVILRRGRLQIKIEGERAAEVVETILRRAMEEEIDRTELVKIFAGPDRPAVSSLIQKLESVNIMVAAGKPAPSNPESPLDIFYWHFGEQFEQVNNRQKQQQIAIIGVNYISRQLAHSLRTTGFANVGVVDYPLLSNLRLFEKNEQIPADWPVDLELPLNYRDWLSELDTANLDCLIATSDVGGLQLMRSWNEFCVKYQKNFLPVVLQDLIGYLGPLVIPGETACFECLRARQNAHFNDPVTRRAAEAVAFEGQAVTGFHPAMASVLADLASIELSKFYGGWTSSRLPGRLIEVNLIAPELTLHRVLKIPRCQVCSRLNSHSIVSVDRDTYLPLQENRE
jgi:thiazole/oxazole-forming peptide maturase SagC family component